MSRFNGGQSVGEIVAAMPAAEKVFSKYSIDFCCGGGRLLADVVREQKLNEAEVLKRLDEVDAEINKENETVMDFRALSPAALIDHIVGAHHAYLKATLPELSGLIVKILGVHGARHQELLKVHKLFHALKTDLEQHLFKEETILFPLIKEHELNPSAELLERVNQVVTEIEDEHEAAGHVLKELERVTEQYRVPDDACRSYALTYWKLQETEADLFRHIHLENNILFKRIR